MKAAGETPNANIASPTSPSVGAQEAVAEHYFVYGLDTSLTSARPLGGVATPVEQEATVHPLDDKYEPALLSRFPARDSADRALPSFTHMVDSFLSLFAVALLSHRSCR